VCRWRNVAAVALTLAVLVQGSTARADTLRKPVDEQNCNELTKTFKRITHDLQPDQPTEVQRRATRLAGKAGDRQTELGGCLTESAKAETPPTSPSGQPGDVGVTPNTQIQYLAVVATDRYLQTLTPDAAIQLGLTFCGDLDTGRSIASEAKSYIRRFKNAGLTAADAEESFYWIASAAAGNGEGSFCDRHSSKVDAYNEAFA
jgi:hypothetical protein